MYVKYMTDRARKRQDAWRKTNKLKRKTNKLKRKTNKLKKKGGVSKDTPPQSFRRGQHRDLVGFTASQRQSGQW